MNDGLLPYFIYPEVFEKLKNNQVQAAIDLIQLLFLEDKIPKKEPFNFFKLIIDIFSEKQNKSVQNNGEFAYLSILKILKSKKIDFKESFKTLDLEKDIVLEINELCQFLIAFEHDYLFKNEEKILADYLNYLFNKLSFYILENSNDYPTHSISGKIWGDGKDSRELCHLLVEYFERNQDLDSAIIAMTSKCRFTVAILNHYPEEVGPDFIKLAKKLEEKKDQNEALRYYKPVLLDFEKYLLDYEELYRNYPNDVECFSLNEIFVLESLIESVHAMTRIENYKDDKQFVLRCQKLLNHIQSS